MKRVAWLSPLAHCGELRAAAYSAAVLPCLCRSLELEVFVDDADLRDPLAQALPVEVFHYHRLHLRDREKPFDFFVYQFEDHPACRFVERTAKVRPGLCLFHDLNLNSLYRASFSHSTAARDINALMDEQFGPSSARLGDYYVRGWPIAAFDKVYPCGRSEIQRAACTAVFSSEALRRLRRSVTGIKHFLLPCACLPCSEQQAAAVRGLLRNELGLDPSGLVIGFWSAEPLADRQDLLLDVFRELTGPRCPGPQPEFIWFVPSGRVPAAESFRAALGPEFEALKRRLRIASLGSNASEPRPAACDVYVSLRSDPRRGFAPGVLQALAAGVPLVACSLGPASDLPQSAVLGVRPGLTGREELVAVLEELISDGALRRAMSSAARQYAALACSPCAAAAELQSIIEESEPVLRRALEEQGVIVRREGSALLSELEQALLSGRVSGVPDELWLDVLQRAADDFGWNREL